MKIKTLAMILLLHCAVFAGEFYMLDFRLQSLRSGQTVDLNDFKGKRLFLTFVKRDCSWCGKQLEAFNTLLEGEHADTVRVVAVAMGDDLEALEAKCSEAAFPVLKASEALRSAIGGVELTPYTLVADRAGNFETKVVGYMNEDQLESIIHQLEGR